MKLWKKVLAAVTAGMLCLGCAGVSGLQGVLGSVSAVLPVCAAENDTAYTVTVPVGTRTTQLTYAVNAEDTVEITDCENDAAGDLEIPAEIDGKTVTSIGDSAFFGCTSLTSVIIPNSVANIGYSVFYNSKQCDQHWRKCFCEYALAGCKTGRKSSGNCKRYFAGRNDLY